MPLSGNQILSDEGTGRLSTSEQAGKEASSICRETGDLAELFQGPGPETAGDTPSGGLALKGTLNVQEAEDVSEEEREPTRWSFCLSC